MALQLVHMLQTRWFDAKVGDAGSIRPALYPDPISSE